MLAERSLPSSLGGRACHGVAAAHGARRVRSAARSQTRIPRARPCPRAPVPAPTPVPARARARARARPCPRPRAPVPALTPVPARARARARARPCPRPRAPVPALTPVPAPARARARAHARARVRPCPRPCPCPCARHLLRLPGARFRADVWHLPRAGFTTHDVLALRLAWPLPSPTGSWARTGATDARAGSLGPLLLVWSAETSSPDAGRTPSRPAPQAQPRAEPRAPRGRRARRARRGVCLCARGAWRGGLARALARRVCASARAVRGAAVSRAPLARRVCAWVGIGESSQTKNTSAQTLHWPPRGGRGAHAPRAHPQRARWGERAASAALAPPHPRAPAALAPPLPSRTRGARPHSPVRSTPGKRPPARARSARPAGGRPHALAALTHTLPRPRRTPPPTRGARHAPPRGDSRPLHRARRTPLHQSSSTSTRSQLQQERAVECQRRAACKRMGAEPGRPRPPRRAREAYRGSRPQGHRARLQAAPGDVDGRERAAPAHIEPAAPHPVQRRAAHQAQARQPGAAAHIGRRQPRAAGHRQRRQRHAPLHQEHRQRRAVGDGRLGQPGAPERSSHTLDAQPVRCTSTSDSGASRSRFDNSDASPPRRESPRPIRTTAVTQPSDGESAHRPIESSRRGCGGQGPDQTEPDQRPLSNPPRHTGTPPTLTVRGARARARAHRAAHVHGDRAARAHGTSAPSPPLSPR